MTLTMLLMTVKPPTVAVTHLGSRRRWQRSAELRLHDGRDREAHLVEGRPTIRLMAVNAPVALRRIGRADRLSPVLFAPAKSGSLTPGWNTPATDMRPASAADFLAFE